MKAVIMAGGFGTRIRPLTSSIPKPMLPVLNIPIMEHVINLLVREGFTEIFVLLFFQPDVIRSYFGDGSKFGVKIHYVLPDRDYGTCGAVGLLRNHIKERFLVISGDLVTNFPLSSMVDFHVRNGAFVTIGLVSVADPLQFGIVITERDGRIVKFLEKPSWGEVFSDNINTGIYVLEPGVFDYIPPGEEYDFSKNLFPDLLKRGFRLFGYKANCYWRDVGDPESYIEVHKDIIGGCVELVIRGERVEREEAVIYCDTGTKIPTDLKAFGKVILGKNVVIGKSVTLKDVSIGDNSYVGDGSVVESSTLWWNVNIGKNVKILESVVCNDVVIADGVTVGRKVVIAEGVKIGEEAEIKDCVKIWPFKVVEDKAVLSDNLIWAERWRRSIFESGKITGLTNRELTPEFVAKLGVAYGSMLKEGAFILVGRDTFPGSRMLSRAFIGGVLSTGVNVRDLHTIAKPVLRYKLEGFGELGGVYLKRNEMDSLLTDIEFFGSNGLVLSSGEEKTIERIFFREEFRRVDVAGQGVIEELAKIKDFYIEGYLKSIDINAIRERGFSIVVDYQFGSSAFILPDILGKMGVRFIGINSGNPISYQQDPTRLEHLSRIVTAIGADIGFSISPDCESITVVDDKGDVLTDEDLLRVIFLLVAKVATYKQPIVFSVTVPEYVERFLNLEGFEVLRAPVSKRKLEEFAMGGNYLVVTDLKGSVIYPYFHRTFDGLFLIALLMEFLAKSGFKLSDALRISPRGFYKKEEIPCIWARKGRIIREIVDEFGETNELVLIDGVKVRFEDGYFLVVPKEDSPTLSLVVEADSISSLIRIEAESKAFISKLLKET